MENCSLLHIQRTKNWSGGILARRNEPKPGSETPLLLQKSKIIKLKVDRGRVLNQLPGGHRGVGRALKYWRQLRIIWQRLRASPVLGQRSWPICAR
jgi:hypothetical protein